MKRTRPDMTRPQFARECAKRGIRPDLLGWYYVTPSRLVWARNGGNTRRAQLAYLIREQNRAIESAPPDTMAEDIPEALRAKFDCLRVNSVYRLTCKVCGGKWSHPVKPIQVGTTLHLLDHAHSHDSH
jgi:hypothetical protein